MRTLLNKLENKHTKRSQTFSALEEVTRAMLQAMPKFPWLQNLSEQQIPFNSMGRSISKKLLFIFITC